MNYTIIIQGPLEKHSIDGIDNYLKYGKVLVSTWDYIDTSSIPDTVKKIVKPLPNISKSVGTISNFYYAVCGMQNALDVIDTEYFVRTRGDEVYKNLDNLIETFESNTNKIVFGNMFARSWDDRPLHIGDHLYVGKTEIARTAFKYLRDMYEGREKLEQWAVQGGQDYNPRTNRHHSSEAEVVLAKTFLHSKNIEINDWYDKNMFLDNFSIIDINSTQEFISSWQNGNQVYKNNFVNPHNVKTILDI